jgi:hypothetical protein
MYTMDHGDMYNGLISQVQKVFDLDRPEIKLLKTDCSKYGVTNFHKCHVHDVLILSIDDDLFYAKGEDVFLRISSRYSLNYRNFLEFSLSLFKLDDCVIQRREFCFADDPDIAAVKFERSLIQRQIDVIEKVTDETNPGDITNPEVRALFVFYLSRKERLVAIDGAVYDDVYTHHGRDVIHEVLASALGQLLQVPVPRNYFAYRTSRFSPAYHHERHHDDPDHHRYVLSKAVYEKNPCPYLVDVLNRKFRDQNIIWGLSLFREESNPLNLKYFQREAAVDPDELGSLIIASCPNYADLIRSDFLDQLLGGTKDRKPYDYLLPAGLEGPIYTVDYGEILFPELMFDTNDPHYLRQKEARESILIDYFRKIEALAADSPYRSTIADMINRYRKIDDGFIIRLIGAIPEKFFLDHAESERYCYQKATMTDFLANQLRILKEQSL